MNFKKVFIILSVLFCSASAIMFDHNCINLNMIPESAIIQAKQDLHVLYAHASHGSQITKGMKALEQWKPSYSWQYNGDANTLDIRDYNRTLTYSGGIVETPGTPNQQDWCAATREYISNNLEINVVIWSFCTELSTYHGIYHVQEYLDSMSALELSYPNIKFVYMTGHVDGFMNDRLVTNNAVIRDYCISNDKILFDFADIEKYDPDGNYFGDVSVTDGSNYDYNNDGITSEGTEHAGHLPLDGDRNWALDWQANHIWYDGSNPQEADYFGLYGRTVADSVRISHTQPANMNMKAYAGWWMFAWLAGWTSIEPAIEIPTTPNNIICLETTATTISLTWEQVINSSNAPIHYIIEQSIDNLNYINIGIPGICNFIAIDLIPNTMYYYRISAINDIGSSDYCYSFNISTDIQSNDPVEIILSENNDTWKFHIGDTLIQDWQSSTLIDNHWLDVQTILGYGDNHNYGTELNDMRNSYGNLYLRKHINLDILNGNIINMKYNIDYDDGFIMYINGVIIASANYRDDMADSRASNTHESGRNQPLEYDGIDFNSAFVDGDNVIAVRVFNHSIGSSDIAFMSDISVNWNLNTIIPDTIPDTTIIPDTIPEPEFVVWTVSDVPLNAIFQEVGNTNISKWYIKTDTYIRIFDINVNYNDLSTYYEYSLDENVWLQCNKPE